LLAERWIVNDEEHAWLLRLCTVMLVDTPFLEATPAKESWQLRSLLSIRRFKLEDRAWDALFLTLMLEDNALFDTFRIVSDEESCSSVPVLRIVKLPDASLLEDLRTVKLQL
jgi:hypothetical protein